ncbi:helix-turn-helix domain-containing protein [Candidatus Poseidoniaceae archaeon]|jgi:DNA-binding transcriptional ArsR family regulator|nr:helix-turn-helix domain-containing protein [Euryarchaeota archaeon]MBT7245299.1 helix-turn-helix domain-containing protein [Euryarchaeota archaeon]MDC0556930.1 helix-turn-helix domain-containing protein [Candidatus Poseidoniaceae archaeon]NCF97855.1 helix-turn-helix domain-containing protein [Euryarchaeota archaeon]
MARIHADPVSTSLMHPTRRALYVALLEADEYTTVQLQKIVGVDRYNLYHHLKKLESLGLVMNHRDQGRTRWWCVIDRVPLPNDGSAVSSDNTLGTIDLSNPRVQAAARTMLRELSELSGKAINFDSATLESLEITGRKN